MSEDSKKNGQNPKGNDKSKGNDQKGTWINEDFNKGQRPDIGGGKSDSGDYGRGNTKPKRPLKDTD